MSKTDYKDLYRSLLDDYLSGRMGDELGRKVRAWLPDSKYPEETDAILKDSFENFVKDHAKPAKETLAAWEKICKELGFPGQGLKPRSLPGSLARRTLKIAAVVIPLLILGGYLFTVRLQRGDTGQPVVAEAVYSAEVAAPADGKKRTLLPDGTEVYLNAGAVVGFDSLNYLSDRKVRLDGEAYFSVVAQEANPFTVDAGDLTVTVLGTEFNIKTADHCGVSEVSLFSGSVEVKADDKLTVLRPKQQLLFQREEGILLVRDFDEKAVGDWRLRLDLSNVNLPKAFSMVEDYFGMPVVVKGGLPEDNSIRVSFKEPTIEEAMNILQLISSGFNYRIEGDTVLVTATK